jgi:hypothetical protein
VIAVVHSPLGRPVALDGHHDFDVVEPLDRGLSESMSTQIISGCQLCHNLGKSNKLKIGFYIELITHPNRNPIFHHTSSQKRYESEWMYTRFFRGEMIQPTHHQKDTS